MTEELPLALSVLMLQPILARSRKVKTSLEAQKSVSASSLMVGFCQLSFLMMSQWSSCAPRKGRPTEDTVTIAPLGSILRKAIADIESVQLTFSRTSK